MREDLQVFEQLDPKISHLSAAQIQALMSRYYQGERIDLLLHEYQVDCAPSQLYRLFPSEVLPENRCPYCDKAMIRERFSRTSPRFSRHGSHCASCGHSEGTGRCRCHRCAVAEQQENERRRREQSLKISEYCRRAGPSPRPQRAARDLGLREAVALLALTRTCPYVEADGSEPVSPGYQVIEALQHATVPFAPKGELGWGLIRELSEAGLLGISEISSIEAFKFEDSEITGYDPSKVRWAVTVADPQLLLSDIEQTASERTSWPPHWADAVKDLWFDIALAECKEYYRYCATERRWPESGATSTDTMLRNLLRDFAVAQCYRVIFAGARNAADFSLMAGCTRSHAANYMIGACQRWADKARAENWDVACYKRNFKLPRSSMSYVFFDVFLKIGEAGFNKAPDSYVFR